MGRAFEYRRAAKEKRWDKMSKVFPKLARTITMAVKEGGPDPDSNSKLRTAILNAKAQNMPKDNIAKAVKKGAGLDGSSERFEEIRYEGYGPGGVAILVDTLISNPKKTAPEIREAFDKNNGNLGQSGSVSFGFTHQGVIFISSEAIAEDELMEIALEAGADDVTSEDGHWHITCPPADFLTLKDALEGAGLALENAELTWTPQTMVQCDDKVARQILRLIDVLDDHDDVQAVHHNAEIPEDSLEG